MPIRIEITKLTDRTRVFKTVASNQDLAQKSKVNTASKRVPGEKLNVLFAEKASIKINLKPFNSAGQGMTIK